MHTGEAARDLHDVSRLVSFASKRNRSQVRTICFDQQAIEWNLLCHFAELISFLERDDAGKGDHEADLERSLRKVHAAAEAMKYSAALRSCILAAQDLDRLSLSLTRVNHDRQIALARCTKLTLENIDLYVAG